MCDVNVPHVHQCLHSRTLQPTSGGADHAMPLIVAHQPGFVITSLHCCAAHTLRRGVTLIYIPHNQWLAAVDLPAAVAAFQRDKALSLLRWTSNHLRLGDVVAQELLLSVNSNRQSSKAMESLPEEEEPMSPQETRHRMVGKSFTLSAWAGNPSGLVLRRMHDVYLASKNILMPNI